MDEANEIPKKEVVETQKSEPKKHSRRSFIGYLASLGAAVGIGGGWGKRSIDSQPSTLDAKSRFPDGQQTQRVDISSNSDQLVHSTPLEETAVESMSTPTPLPEKKPRKLQANNATLKDYLSEERAGLDARVGEEVSLIENIWSEEELKNTLERCEGYRSIVNGVASELELDQDFRKSGIIDLIPNLIFVESNGKPESVSDAIGAKGLCQLKDDTAAEQAAKIGMTSYDIFDPKTNITLAMKYLEEMYRYFPETGLTIWSYHLGMGNMVDAVANYLGRSDVTIDNAFAGEPPLIAQLITNGRINFENLVESLYVQSQIKNGKFGDDTQHYFPRVLAAEEMTANDELKVAA